MLSVHLYMSVPLCLFALLTASNYLPAPFRDGLNRLPMEFTLARHQAGQLFSSSQHIRTEGEYRNSTYTRLI